MNPSRDFVDKNFTLTFSSYGTIKPAINRILRRYKARDSRAEYDKTESSL